MAVSKVPSMYYRYFVYSSNEESLKIKVHGKNAKFGTVIVNGIPKRYTSIVADSKKVASDGIIVKEGDIRKIRYTHPATNQPH